MEATEAPTAAEYLPAAQLVQEAALVCAVKPENLPASQLVQTVDPAVAWCLPAPQLMQVLATVAPTVVEYVPAVQLVQTVEAVPAAYLPAPQGTRSADLPAQKYPAGHSTPEGVDEPSGQ